MAAPLRIHAQRDAQSIAHGPRATDAQCLSTPPSACPLLKQGGAAIRLAKYAAFLEEEAGFKKNSLIRTAFAWRAVGRSGLSTGSLRGLEFPALKLTSMS